MKRKKERKKKTPLFFYLPYLFQSGLLELLHQVVPGSRARQPRPPVPLEVEGSKLAVGDDRGIALGALVAERALGVEDDVVAQGPRELPARVGEHRDPGLLRSQALAPGGHDEGVVDGDEDDRVRSGGFQLLGLLDRSGHVALVAGRGERARDREERDLLPEGRELDLVARGGAVEGDVGDGVAGLFLFFFFWFFGFFFGRESVFFLVGVEFFFLFSMDFASPSIKKQKPF